MDIDDFRRARNMATLSEPFMYACEVLTWIAFQEPDRLFSKDQGRTVERIKKALPHFSWQKILILMREAKQNPRRRGRNHAIALSELNLQQARRADVALAVRSLLTEVGSGRLTAYACLDSENVTSSHQAVPVEVFMGDRVTITLNDRIQEGDEISNGKINRGPDYRDVRFKTAEVLAIWPQPARDPVTAEQAAVVPSTRPAPFDYRTADADLLREMERLIAAGSATGPMNAARAVASRAVGKGSEESKVKRLLGGWKRQHSE